MRSARVAAVIAATLLALPALGACTGGDEPAAEAPVAEPTSLTELATDELVVAREPFCARVAPAAVEEALGGPADDAREWVDGERSRVAPGVRDVVHEFGCRWRGVDGTTVSGWVFAPPVTPGRAAGLARAAARAEGCSRVGGAPAYGSRSVAVRCTGGKGPVTTSFHGLFGDAWLSCSMAGATADLARVGRWCVSVALAAAR